MPSFLPVLSLTLLGACSTSAESVYRSNATNVAQLQVELQEQVAIGRELPGCVVATSVPGWGSERHHVDIAAEGAWLRDVGYVWCCYEPQPLDESGAGCNTWALFLDPKVIACLTTGEEFAWAMRELHVAGVPACYRLSNGVYLEVPGRREREALDVLHDSTNRPANAGSIYPRK